MIRSEYSTYTNGERIHHGDSLEEAVRIWNDQTHGMPAPAGGVKVESFNTEPGVLVRVDWILYVRKNGSVYLNPGIKS